MDLITKGGLLIPSNVFGPRVVSGRPEPFYRRPRFYDVTEPEPFGFHVHNADIRGRLKCMVVEKGRVVREYPWEKNLITNAGMDRVPVDHFPNNMQYCHAGTGTNDTSTDSGATTASQSTTTVTASASIFTAAMVGDTIKWDTSEEARIVTFTSGTSVEVANSATVASGQFTIWHTGDNTLQTPHKQSNTYLTGSGNCGSSISSATITHRRTYDFTAESGSVTINEVGVSWNGTSGGDLFTRKKLTSGIALTSGQQLRVVYDILVTLSPTTLTALTPSITNWPVAPAVTVAGDHQIVGVCMQGINDTGGVANMSTRAGVFGAGDANDVSADGAFNEIFLLDSSAVPAAFNTTSGNLLNEIYAAQCTLQTYTALSFTTTKRLVVPVGSGNEIDIRTIGIGTSDIGVDPYDANRYGWLFVFDENQTKANTHTLTINLNYSWTRTLA